MKRERSDGGSSVSKKKKQEPKADLVRSRNPPALYRMLITLITHSIRHAVRTPVVTRLGRSRRRKIALGLAAAQFLPPRPRPAAVEPLRVSCLECISIEGAHHDSIAACGPHRCGAGGGRSRPPPPLYRHTPTHARTVHPV